ncbi:MAG: thioredoxin family protein [Elainellaceae cyanobacterium]
MIHAVSPVGSYAPDFELPDINHIVHHLARYLDKYDAVAVIMMSNHCPYVQAYLERLKQLQTEFEPQGVTLIGINSNDDRQVPQDSLEQMQVFAAEHQLNFPYLRDVAQDVAQGFRATTTPQAFLIDQASVICYVGAIDNSPKDASTVSQTYLHDAISLLINSKTISIPTTNPVGCSVKWRKN